MSYRKFPEIPVLGHPSHRGWQQVAHQIQQAIAGRTSCVVAVDCYMGTRVEEIIKGLAAHLNFGLVLRSEDAAKSKEELDRMLARNLTEDRVFGVMSSYLNLREFFVPDALRDMGRQVQDHQGLTLVCGVGAAFVAHADILVYADLARWEIQQRYRSGEIGNWRADNQGEDVLRKYKRGFFVEWRVCDKHKRDLFPRMDYLLETNREDDPVMVSREAFEAAMAQAVSGPFRTVPYFDPGVWGGQWMRQHLDLPEGPRNYAWSFDGVLEENSILLNLDGVFMELPAMNLVLTQAENLLGPRVFSRFGAEFPIRFDFLDTWDGQNLSLQVHPSTQYIRETFGMAYTQDESYYILDAKPGAEIYLGLKQGIDRAAMLKDLHTADQGGAPFPADRYINRFPVRKHDHVSIPAGTLHCSAEGCMVLEISATPYIFTFKLWDWGRLGLDGRPRPVHLDHGAKNIRWERDTAWVQQNLLNQEHLEQEGPGWRLDHTGLHELQFIRTQRITTRVPVTLSNAGSFSMLNLVEGQEAVIQSPQGRFPPFPVYYAETFIIPWQAGDFIVSPAPGQEHQDVRLIRAWVRS